MVKTLSNIKKPFPTSNAVEDKYKNILRNAKAECRIYAQNYASDETLTNHERSELLISHAYLQVIIPYANVGRIREIFFKILFDEKNSKEESQELDIIDGDLVNSECSHKLPLTSPDAFRRYIQRAKKKGIYKTLVHGNKGQSKKSKWNEILKEIVILYAIDKVTHCSSNEIYHDLENLIDDYPDIVKQGVHLVKPSTIRKFLKEKAGAYISFAKDNPNDFKRKILGVLRFIPPSAPLVRIGVDGYVFQVICSDDDTRETVQLVAEIIYDYKSKAILGLAFGKTETNETFRRAFYDYFKNTGNRLPREIVMDKFSAHTCRKVKNLNEVLKRYCVSITRSSQPNNNARLERFFGVLQTMYQGPVLQASYIGAGITSKGENARPSKKIQIILRKSEFLKGETEMIHLLTHLIKEVYNKEYNVLGKNPMTIFESQQSNHLKVLTDTQVAYMTFDKHQNTIIGCGIFIKRGDYLYLYKERSLEVATNLYRHKVNVYIDNNNPSAPAYIFSQDTSQFLLKMKILNIVPCSIFDRTEEEKDFIKNYNRQTRELIIAIQAQIHGMETDVEKLLGGRDFRDSKRAAKIKKEADGSYLQTQIGLKAPKPEPKLPYTNALNTMRTKKTKITNEQNLILKYHL